MSNTNIKQLIKIRKETLLRLYYLKAVKTRENKVHLINIKAKIKRLKEELEMYQSECNHPFLTITDENTFSCLECQKVFSKEEIIEKPNILFLEKENFPMANEQKKNNVIIEMESLKQKFPTMSDEDMTKCINKRILSKAI